MSRTPAQRQMLALLCLLPLAARPAAAQLSLSPTVGVYAPTADLVNAVITGNALTFKQQVGLALGGRLGIGLGPRVSLSVTGSYVPSSLQATLSSSGLSQDATNKTNLYFGTGRLNLWLVPPTSPLSLGINGGVGVVGRSSTVATDANGQTYTDGARRDVGGVVGATIGVHLGPIGAFVSADDYIYKPSVFEQLGVTAATQNDVQVSFGLGTPIGSRRGRK